MIRCGGESCNPIELPYMPPLMKDQLLDLESLDGACVNGQRKGLIKINKVIWQFRKLNPSVTVEVDYIG